MEITCLRKLLLDGYFNVYSNLRILTKIKLQ